MTSFSCNDRPPKPPDIGTGGNPLTSSSITTQQQAITPTELEEIAAKKSLPEKFHSVGISTSDHTHDVGPTPVDGRWPNYENDPSKARLLGASCNSHTRAWEAAKRACAEKEHSIQFIFRQASQLFAYKQWFQILQLEKIYFQIKNNKSQQISTISPLKFPWVPQITKKTQNSWHKSGRGKHGKQSRARYDISKYAIDFALGLGVVSAGLFLGWTVGCMLPSL